MSSFQVGFTGSVKYYTAEPNPTSIGRQVTDIGDLERLTEFVERVVALSGGTIQSDPDKSNNALISAYLNDNLNPDGFYALVNGSTTGGDIWTFDGYSNVHPLAAINGALEFVSDGDGGSWQVAIRCTIS